MTFKVYSSEFLVLIRASSVREIFNQHDLATRQNSDRPLLDKYHVNWIRNDTMLVPSFFIKDNEAQVGNGRHRFTMLSRHMEFIPAAFELRFSKSNDLERVLSKIVVRDMVKFEEFEYPDLPIEDLGDDVNGGKDWKKYLDTNKNPTR